MGTENTSFGRRVPLGHTRKIRPIDPIARPAPGQLDRKKRPAFISRQNFGVVR